MGWSFIKSNVHNLSATIVCLSVRIALSEKDENLFLRYGRPHLSLPMLILKCMSHCLVSSFWAVITKIDRQIFVNTCGIRLFGLRRNIPLANCSKFRPVFLRRSWLICDQRHQVLRRRLLKEGVATFCKQIVIKTCVALFWWRKKKIALLNNSFLLFYCWF